MLYWFYSSDNSTERKIMMRKMIPDEVETQTGTTGVIVSLSVL